MKGKLTIHHGSIVNAAVDAIIIPANSTGSMPGGVGLAIKTVGGQEIEEEALHIAPIPIGEAIMTFAGTLRCTYILHACISEYPDGKTDEQVIASALDSALTLAKNNNFYTIAICGIKTGTVPRQLAAMAMIETISAFKSHFSEIILTDIDEEMVNAWKEKHMKN